MKRLVRIAVTHLIDFLFFLVNRLMRLEEGLDDPEFIFTLEGAYDEDTEITFDPE